MARVRPTPPSSSSDTTVVSTGTRSLLFGLPGCLLLAVPGALAVVRLVVEGVTVGAAVASALLLLLAALGALGAAALWRNRHATIVVDATGITLAGLAGRQAVPWSTLGAVGVHTSRWRLLTTYSVELCPREPVEEPGPALRPLLRREAPPRPGLPDTRYRLYVPFGTRRVLLPAVRRHCPADLWFGEVPCQAPHLRRARPLHPPHLGR